MYPNPLFLSKNLTIPRIRGASAEVEDTVRLLIWQRVVINPGGIWVVGELEHEEDDEDTEGCGGTVDAKMVPMVPSLVLHLLHSTEEHLPTTAICCSDLPTTLFLCAHLISFLPLFYYVYR